MSEETNVNLGDGDLGAYALGALNPDEKSAVRAKLRHSSEMRVELAEYAAVLQGLAKMSPAVEPPDALRASILQKATASIAQPIPERAGLLGWIVRRIAVSRAVLTVYTLGCVALFGAMGWRIATLSAQNAQQRPAYELLFGDDARSWLMRGNEAAPEANAIVRYKPDEKLMMVEVHDLPELPAGQTYQAWFSDADGVVDTVGLFNVTDASRGRRVLFFTAPRAAKVYVKCGVSVEPAGGSPKPTGPTALLWVRPV